MITPQPINESASAVQAEKRDRGAVAAPVTHAEPQRGGSYTRNLETGTLVPATPVSDKPAE